MTVKENWSVTYQNWTPSDIEAGETRDLGFIYEACSLRDALKEVGNKAHIMSLTVILILAFVGLPIPNITSVSERELLRSARFISLTR
jgi:hypothetical protein